MTDPDAGTTTYTYDALGRERSRTDANNIVNVTNYDYLGRVTSCASVTYTYGTNGTDQMRLKSKSYGGWTETYEYDAYGNITHETMSNGTNITRHRYYTYNANGQLTGRTLPGNMTYGYSYDAYGNLTGMNGAGGAVQWSLAEYTGRRTVSHTVLNGSTLYPFVKTHVFDQFGYLDSIKVVQHDNWWYQEDDYNFSPVTGNLMSVNNRMSDGEVWTFVYDDVDRLTKVRENNQDIMEMAYAANGNITSKTGIGSYTYNSSSKPHAVTEVDNTAGGITLQVQDVEYNNWNKAYYVWAYDENDFYSFSIGYGPDMQRVTSEMHKTYQKQYKKFYWDDYEEKVMGTDTLHYYYVYGTDGLAGLHIVKTGPNIQTTTHTTKVITDHLGSIVSLIDNSDYVYDVQYDVWGGREVMLSYDFDPTFDRGYTGHEHLDALNLINMNGRMYDPQLGRFLSPDPFIQAPTDPQNYNRYSYCLNNPLKYTDPDGEWFWIPAVIIGAYLGGSAVNGTFNLGDWDYSNWQTYAGIAVGGLAGYAGAAIGASVAASAVAGGASTISAGAAGGMVGGMVSGGINGAGMTAIMGGNINDIMYNMTTGMVMGGFGGAISGGIGAAIGDFSGVAGGSFKNGMYELGHSALKGAATGLAEGAMMAAMEQDASYLWKGALMGAALNTGLAGLRITALGTSFIPDSEYGSLENFGQVYRRGSIFIKNRSGITIGRNVSVKLTGNYELDCHLLQHETGHLSQISDMGVAKFYSRTVKEYMLNGFRNTYCTSGTLEYSANYYAYQKLGYYYNYCLNYIVHGHFP